MRELFHGWRRKAGVVTLMMACFVMGMWLRSQFIEESAGVLFGGQKYLLYSADGELGFFVSTPEQNGFQNYWWSRDLRRGYRLGWPVVVSYVDFALVMTLLSAYLILWKPRKRDCPPGTTAAHGQC